MRKVLLAIFCGWFAVWQTKAETNARVEYVHPENFTDVSFRSMTPQGAQDRLARELTRTI